MLQFASCGSMTALECVHCWVIIAHWAQLSFQLLPTENHSLPTEHGHCFNCHPLNTACHMWHSHTVHWAQCAFVAFSQLPTKHRRTQGCFWVWPTHSRLNFGFSQPTYKYCAWQAHSRFEDEPEQLTFKGANGPHPPTDDCQCLQAHSRVPTGPHPPHRRANLFPVKININNTQTTNRHTQTLDLFSSFFSFLSLPLST